MATGRSNIDALCILLDREQLTAFYDKIKRVLMVTKPSHFAYVYVEDLAKIGMSAPAARRLIAASRQEYIKELEAM